MKAFCLLPPTSYLLALLLATGNGTIAVAQSNSNCDRLGPLVTISGGEARIQRGDSNYQLARVGDVLCRGDRIKLEKNTRAIIRCEINNQEALYISGRESGAANVCPPVSLCDVRDCNRDPNSRISAGIISPRNTALLTNQPSFIWHPVANATSYMVVLRTLSGEEVWRREVSTTQMSYPADQPPLTSGITYELTVTPAQNKNVESAKSKFLVLNEKYLQIVQDYVSSAEWDKTVEIPALVYLYLNDNLREEAIKILEDLVKQGKESAAVQLWLGDLYWQVELPDLAKESYSRAKELAKVSGNSQGEQLAQDRIDELRESARNEN